MSSAHVVEDHVRRDLLDRIDIKQLLDRVDMDRLLARVVGLDTVLVGVVGTVLRRRLAGIGAAPPALRPAEGERDLRTVTGTYAGPLSRLVASGIDAALMFVLFTFGVAGIDLLLGVFLDSGLEGRGDSLWSGVAVVGWIFTYVLITTIVAGRTPGKAIIGLRVVTSSGLAVTPGRALLRTVLLPIAAALLGPGLLPILLARTRGGSTT